MKAENLVRECENHLNGRFFYHAASTFVGRLDDMTKDIHFERLEDKSEKEKFIKVCEGRIERGHIFSSEIAMLLGFDITGIVVIIGSLLTRSEGVKDPMLNLLLHGGDFGDTFRIFFALLILALFLLFIMLGHYRIEVHAWTAFKEKAILSRKATET